MPKPPAERTIRQRQAIGYSTSQTFMIALHRQQLPIGLALVITLGALLWDRSIPATDSIGWSTTVALILIAALAGLHAPLRSEGLSLGAMVLPVVSQFFPTATIGWLAGGAWILRTLTAAVWYRGSRLNGASRDLLSQFSAAGNVVVAATVGSIVWKACADLEVVPPVEFSWLLRTAVAAIAYSISFFLVALVGSLGRSAKQRSGALMLDLGGWLLGGLAVQLISALGWFMGFLLLGCCTALSLEAARGLRHNRIAAVRAKEQREATLAGHRIIFRRPDPEGIAEQVFTECKKLIRFSWFHVELRDSSDDFLSWRSGAGGQIEEGTPKPPIRPAPRPGLHRRVEWQIVGRVLKAEGVEIARLRLWCDPRDLQETQLELFDSLLPQMASAVQRALLDRRSKQDALTGLSDRGALKQRLDRTFEDCREQGGRMAVVMCDLDHFKQINDEYGHSVGDQALVRVAKLIELHRRDRDLCGRYGGEEFVLVLEDSDGQTALTVAERLRHAVETFVFIADDRRIALRISAGVAAFPELYANSGDEVLDLADEALYEAKRQGRNLALLNLGLKCYRSGEGDLIEGEGSEERPEIPRLF